MSCKGYASVGLTLGETRLGTVFEEIKLTVVNTESDQLGMDTLLKASSKEIDAAPTTANALSDVDTMELTIKKLLRTLEGVMEHVEKVTTGNAEADPKVVRLLQDLVAAAPRLPAASFDKMFNAQVQDILAVVYLANLTRTQLALAEKLQAVAISAAN